MVRVIWKKVRRKATPKNLALAGAGLCLIIITIFVAGFFWPRNINFSYAGNTCFANPALLPGLIAKKQARTFAPETKSTLAFFGLPLYSHKTCVEPRQAPAEKIIENISLHPLGIPFLKKSIRVSSGSLPKVASLAPLEKPVSTKDPLILPLNTNDKIFGYQALVNNKKADCESEGKNLKCNLASLGLEQSASYQLVLMRMFNGKTQNTLLSQSFVTVGSVQVAGSSIAGGQTVFDAPTEMSLTFNKPIKSFGGLELYLVTNENRQQIPVNAEPNGQNIKIKFNSPLPRQASFELVLNQAEATDDGYLPSPFVLAFATSGGPKVKSASIGSYKVGLASNIVLALDSAPAPGQGLSEFFKVEINGAAVPAAVSASGNRVTINPEGDLPRCARFTVRAVDGLKNEFGISGGSAWKFNSRAMCQEVFSIGKSVQGRNITGYRFGTGGSKIILVATTHGDEKSSTSTLNSFIDELEKDYDKIPGQRTVIIIPNLNPDGYASSRRTNANNIDLNRNFPANDWKQGVTMPGGSFNPNGGGAYALSEPESSALASYVLGQNPRLVLTYHAAAGVVIANGSGDSEALAHVYDQKSNVGYSSGAGLFNYDTTGAFEDWLRDKHGIPTILVELWTKSSNEFSRNSSAMWHMVTLP
jgi:protein MpaA